MPLSEQREQQKFFIMRRRSLLALSLLALCATVVHASDPEAMNIEIVDEASVSILISDVKRLTFDIENDQMTVEKSSSATFDIAQIKRITFGDYTESADIGTALNSDMQDTVVNIYGTDAVHVECTEGIDAVSIVAANGAQVFMQRYDAQPTAVVANTILARGIYVVLVDTHGKRISQKIRIK